MDIFLLFCCPFLSRAQLFWVGVAEAVVRPQQKDLLLLRQREK